MNNQIIKRIGIAVIVMLALLLAFMLYWSIK